MAMKPIRDRRVEVRWRGDAQSEVEAIAALGYPSMMEAGEGLCERWMRVPSCKVGQVREAIEHAGGKLLERHEART